jgi:hypothetical protein
MWTVLGLLGVTLIVGGLASAGMLAWRADRDREARGKGEHGHH